jgi:hypothetical protein
VQRALTAGQIFHQELKKQATKVEFLAGTRKKKAGQLRYKGKAADDTGDSYTN